MRKGCELRTSHVGHRMTFRETVAYSIVVLPCAFGMVGALVGDDPLWLILGLAPALVWGWIEECLRHRR